MANVTAEQIVAVVNQLGLSLEQVGAAFASAKVGVQAKTIQSLLEQAAQKDAVLQVGENEQLQPYIDELQKQRDAVDVLRSQRANAMSSAKALLSEVAAGRLLTDAEMADLKTLLEFGK